MTDHDRRRLLWLGIRRALLTFIYALDEYFGVKKSANGGETMPVALNGERV